MLVVIMTLRVMGAPAQLYLRTCFGSFVEGVHMNARYS